MFKRLGIYKSILLSYMLILIIPFSVLFCIVISSVGSSYEQRIMDIRTAHMEQTAERLDLRLRECRGIAAELSQNRMLSRHMLSKSGYDGYQAIQILSMLKGSNEFLLDIGVYYYGDDFVTLSNGMIGRNVVLKDYGLNEHESEYLWQLMAQKHGRPRLKSIRKGWRLAYFVPLPFNYNTCFGCVVFILEGSSIGDLFPVLENPDTDVQLLLDADGNMLYGMGRTDLAQDTLLGQMLASERIRISERNYWSIVKQSGLDTTLYAASLVSESSLRPTLAIYIAILLCSGVLLVVCLALATWFTMRTWIPIRDLGDMLIPELKTDSRNAIQWESIQGAVRDTLARNMQVEDVLEDHYQIMRENLLLRLIHGQIDEGHDLKSELRMMGLPEDCESACVLSVMLPEARYAGLVFDRLDKHANCICAMESGSVHHVIAGVFPGRMENDVETIRGIADGILDEMRRVEAPSCIVGVGRRMPLCQLKWSYLQAMAALKVGNKRFGVFYIDDPPPGSLMLPELREKEMIFALALSQGNCELAMQMADEMMSFAVSNAPSVLKYTCYCLLNRTIKVCEEDGDMDKELSRWFNQEWHVLAGLIDESGNTLFQARLKANIQTICERIERLNKQREDKYTSVVENFIQANFMDKNFSLDSLAGEFGSTTAYWSRFVKEKLGVNFSDYVWQLRLNLSKELLRTTNLAVKDVVERVGYLDTRSFIRKFKNSEGITPGQYKTMYIVPNIERNDHDAD